MEERLSDWSKPSKTIDCFDDWPELAELFEQNETFLEDSARSNGQTFLEDSARSNGHALYNNTQKLDQNSRQLSIISQIDDVSVAQDVGARENKVSAVETEILNDHCPRYGNISTTLINHECLAAQEQASEQGQQMFDNLSRGKFEMSNIAADAFHGEKSNPLNFEAITLLHDNCPSRHNSTENTQINTADQLNDQNSRSSNSSSIDQFTLESIIQPLDEHVLRQIFETEDKKNYDVLLSNQNPSVAAMSPPPIDSTKRSRNESKRPRKKARKNNLQGRIGLPMQPIKPLAPYNFFFRDERDNLCFGEYGPDGSLPLPVCDFTFEKQQKLLADHWYIDPFKGKRKHRKNHGRVSFTELSSIIAERWRNLPKVGREFYERLAQLDLAHYEQSLSRTKKPNRITLFSSSAYQPEPKQSLSEQDMSWLDEEQRWWEWDDDSM